MGKKYEKKFSMVCLSMDWHPPNHCSFQSNNKGSELFKPFKLPSEEMQVMWPDHCVQGSNGAKLHSELNRTQHLWTMTRKPALHSTDCSKRVKSRKLYAWGW